MRECVACSDIKKISDLRAKRPFLKRAAYDKIKRALMESDGPIGISGLHCAGKSAVVRSLLGENDIFIEADLIDGLIKLKELKKALESKEKNPSIIVIDEATVLVSSNVDSLFMRFRNITNALGQTLELIDYAKRNDIKVLMIYHSIRDIPDRIRNTFGISEEVVIPVTLTEDEMQQLCGCDGLFPRIGIELDKPTHDLLMEHRFVSMISLLLDNMSIGRLRSSSIPNIAGDQIYRITRCLTETQIEDLVSLFEGRNLPSEQFRNFVELGLVEQDGRFLGPMRDLIAPMSERKRFLHASD